MKLYVLIDEAGYIVASSPDGTISTEKDTVNCIEIDVPEGFDVLRQREYKLVDGELVHDPLPEPEPEPEPTLNDVMEALLGVSEDE